MQDYRMRCALVAAVTAALFAGALGGIPALLAAMACAVLIVAGMPVFRTYAMARPNARSSHSVPVPQGGGSAVAAAAISVAAIGMMTSGAMAPDMARFAWIAAGTLLLAVIGAIDDTRGLPVLPRLGGQMLAVAMAVLGAGGGAGFLPLPYGVECVLLIVAGTWFVNLTNFMDGIDGITLAGFMPLAGGALILASTGQVTPLGGLLAACFLGALAGFVGFNWHPARLFLGDVGSLPIGLLGGILLLDMAQGGAWAAAVILPLYHFTDATLTLAGRLLRREKVWEAHRQHAYQRAVDSGWSATRVSGVVLALNTVLVALAVFSIGKSPISQTALVGLATVCVLAVIVLFRGRHRA
jgi:UDP-N-acetylmuramyl pentapeptide phosphotransferase/UDP-N-acetylglucosamine-1-phosphate transferase